VKRFNHRGHGEARRENALRESRGLAIGKDFHVPEGHPTIARQFIYDACQSGSFLPLLTPPEGKERILIASTEADKSAVYQKLPGLPGEISFSRYLWDRIYEGDELKKAFIVGREAMKNHSRRNQISQMDMNGNGIGNEGEDMRLAEGVAIGRASPLAPFKLKIAKVCPEQTLKDETSATLWAPKASMVRRAFPAYRQ